MSDLLNGFTVRIVYNFTNTPWVVLLQNINGPCPLLALMNVLLLRREIHLSSQAIKNKFVSISEILSSLSMYIQSRYPKNLPKDEFHVNQMFSSLLSLLHGLTVNCYFGDFKSCEITENQNIFYLLNISLVHGWVTCSDRKVPLLGCLGYPEMYSYDDMINYIAYHSELSSLLEEIERFFRCDFDRIMVEVQFRDLEPSQQSPTHTHTMITKHRMVSNLTENADLLLDDGHRVFYAKDCMVCEEYQSTDFNEAPSNDLSESVFLSLNTKHMANQNEKDVGYTFLVKVLQLERFCQDLDIPCMYIEDFMQLIYSRCLTSESLQILKDTQLEKVMVFKTKQLNIMGNELKQLLALIERFWMLFKTILKSTISRQHRSNINENEDIFQHAARIPSTCLTIQGFMNDAHRLEQFLQDTAHQLTATGLHCLRTLLLERDYVVLFRNNHFGVIQRRGHHVYQLITDIAYSTTHNIFWERLDDTHGNTTYYDVDFIPSCLFAQKYGASIINPQKAPWIQSVTKKKKSHTPHCFFFKPNRFSLFLRGLGKCLPI